MWLPIFSVSWRSPNPALPLLPQSLKSHIGGNQKEAWKRRVQFGGTEGRRTTDPRTTGPIGDEEESVEFLEGEGRRMGCQALRVLGCSGWEP